MNRPDRQCPGHSQPVTGEKGLVTMRVAGWYREFPNAGFRRKSGYVHYRSIKVAAVQTEAVGGISFWLLEDRCSDDGQTIASV